MSDFDKRFDEAKNEKFPTLDLSKQSYDLGQLEENDRNRKRQEGSNWTKPALKAAYEALKLTNEVTIAELEEPVRQAFWASHKALAEIEKLLGGEG